MPLHKSSFLKREIDNVLSDFNRLTSDTHKPIYPVVYR